MEEIWKDIRGFIGCYQVSSYGHIRSVDRIVHNASSEYLRKGQLIKPWEGKTSPYYMVSLSGNGKCIKRMVHRIVAEHFLPEWDTSKEVNHIDGNKHNNRVDNLEMCSRQENISHSIDARLRNDSGENSSNAKLTNEQARYIRELHRSGIMQVELAQRFGVCKQTICDIVHNKKYKDESN